MMVPSKKWIILRNEENYCIPVAFALTAAHPSSTASLSGFALSHEVPEGWCLGRPLAVFCITEIRAIFILDGCHEAKQDLGKQFYIWNLWWRDDPGLTVTDGHLSFWWIAPLCITLQDERRGTDEKNMQMCPWFDSTVMRLDLNVVR